MCYEVEVSIKLTVAVVAGLFSLLGAIIGAFLARRTQYEKWLLENRSEVFAKFLELIHEAREEVTNIIYEKEIEESLKSIKITETYSKPLNYAKVVRLYLPRNQRDKFQKLANEVWALHSNPDLGDTRLLTMDKKLDEIQEIFESSV